MPIDVSDKVSIHAFRGEGDQGSLNNAQYELGFNPRLPGGRRPDGWTIRFPFDGFNPRLPGGRRPGAPDTNGRAARVSIHAFRGEGDARGWSQRRAVAVSIHAFRGEGDCEGRLLAG